MVHEGDDRKILPKNYTQHAHEQCTYNQNLPSFDAVAVLGVCAHASLFVVGVHS